jgi:PTS system fructose-specific IIA component/PTS system nitrogen regulatory IIA component
MHRQLSFDQACEHLRIPPQVLRDAVKYNEVPHRKQGDTPVFDAAELDAWGSQRILALQLKELAPEHTASTRKNASQLTNDILLPLLFRPEFVDLDFRAKTRKSVMRDLVDKAEALELLYDPTDLLAQIEQREAVSSTALPGGIALLHPHHPDPYLITEPFMLLARTSRPVWFGAEDDAPTDLFCLICCGENLRHLHVLARLCMMIRDTELLQHLREAQSPEDLCECIYAAERAVLMKLR